MVVITIAIIGLLITIAAIITDKDKMRVDFNIICKFLAFMAIVICARLCFTSFLSDIFDIPINDSLANNHNNWSLGLVFWEDAFFAISIYLIQKYTKIKKPLWIAIVILLSAYFGFLHIYQGIFMGAIASLYPYFVSYRYGVKYGFGTVMVCHVLYDHITVYLAKLMPLLLN